MSVSVVCLTQLPPGRNKGTHFQVMVDIWCLHQPTLGRCDQHHIDHQTAHEPWVGAD